MNRKGKAGISLSLEHKAKLSVANREAWERDARNFCASFEHTHICTKGICKNEIKSSSPDTK